MVLSYFSAVSFFGRFLLLTSFIVLLFSVVRAPLAGKRPRTEVGNTSRRGDDATTLLTSVLSLASVSGPVWALSPFSPE